MSTVRQLLAAIHQEEVFSVPPEVTIYEAMELMAEKNVGALLIVKDDKLVGVVSERDVARRVVLDPRIASYNEVSMIMTEDPSVVSPFAALEDVEDLMARKNVRHLPVVDDGKVVGVVSMKDILVLTRRDQELVAMQYESYINGRT